MKKILFVLTMVLMSVCSFGQTLHYDSVSTIKTRRMSYIDYTKYVASDGTTFAIGDYVTFGQASLPQSYNYIFTYVPLTTPTKISPNFNGSKYEIVRITLNGDENNKHIGLWVNAKFMGAKYLIDLEPAIASGEIVTNSLTSAKALDELATWKKKLELGIIDDEEYNKHKEELIKYIK